MQRIELLAGQVNGKKHVANPMEFMRLYDMLSPELNAVRLKVREFADTHVAPTINDYVETASFPYPIVEAAKKYKLVEHLLDPPYGVGACYLKTGIIYMELGRVDAGLATFFAVQCSLLAYTLEKLASEEQKKKYLSKVRDLELIGGWGLTEKEYGSDASSLETNVRKVEGGYVLNGNKRWIGNGNRDILIVWARNTETKQIEGFILEMGWKGIKSEVIKNKLALRIVQNCQLTFTDVFIPDSNKLNKVKDFQTGPNVVLAHSRVAIPWLAVGVMIGVYESVIKQLTERKQFNKHLGAYQLQQERLVRIVTTLEASFLLAHRVATLANEGKASIGLISSCKAWISDKAREVARLGREMLGGNGIITDNYVIKALTDAEVIYTYEGTYDVNCLVAGRELTGISAFK